MALISLRTITLAFGGPPIFNGINLQIEPGDRLCLMGRNGSDKSTLLKLIGGELAPESGDIHKQQGLKVAALTQDVPQGLWSHPAWGRLRPCWPMSTMTLKMGIERAMKAQIPGVKEVVQV